MMTKRQPNMLDSMISKTERKIEKFERKKKRLEALRDVYKHVKPSDIAIRLKNYLGEEKYDVKNMELFMKLERYCTQLPVILVHF